MAAVETPSESSETAAARRSLRPLYCYLFGLFAGAALGWYLGLNGHMVPKRPPPRIPMPHLVPQLSNGTALQFVMVDDVLHQRFVKHGNAYFELRVKETKKAVDDVAPDDRGGVQHLDFLDDYAVGLERLGKSEQAAEVMRDKLKLQQQTLADWEAKPDKPGVDELTPMELALYRTYANLGTFLIHAAFPRVIRGDASARPTLREGLRHIRKAVEINPGAHFGRENWQIIAVEFLLKALDNPRLLLQYDLVGNRLDAEIPADGHPHKKGWVTRWQSLAKSGWRETYHELRNGGVHNNKQIRDNWITKVGAEAGWTNAVGGTHAGPVPFDEPMLGIVGMWTLGGGANPHFALAIGGTMERVGKPRLAWIAYERAAAMSKRFWPDAGIQKEFSAHCRRRQTAILNRLGESANEAELREMHNRELQQGRDLQAAMADYEAERIAGGESPGYANDRRAKFYRDFYERHGKITSEADDQDWIFHGDPERDVKDPLAAVVFYAGLGALLMVLLVPRRSKNQPD